MMRSLYLLRSHGQVGLDGEQVVVRCEQEELQRVPLPQLDQILVHGNLQLTTPLIRACLERRTLLVDPINVWLIRTGRIKADGGFEHREGGVFLDAVTRRLWMNAWAEHMAEEVQLAADRRGPRWELLDELVRSFVRFVYDPAGGLTVPHRR